MTIEELEHQVAELREKAYRFVRSGKMRWFKASEGQRFVADCEEQIRTFRKYNQTSRDLRDKLSDDFKTKFAGRLCPPEWSQDAKVVSFYLQLLVDLDDARMLAAGAWAPAFIFQVPRVDGDLQVTVKLNRGPEGTKREVTSFFKKIHDRDLKKYEGTSGSHLLQYHLRKTLRDESLYVYSITITKLKPAPPPPPKNTILIGYYLSDQPIVLTPKEREEHVYLLGRPRSGKTTLIRSMALQDMEQGSGVAIIDPHGDLITDILPLIPKHREQDVILFSPDTKIPLNIFRASNELEKAQLADDIITLFERLKGTPGARMDAILRHTIRTLLEIPGATFLDIHRILTDDEYREWAVRTANVPALTTYWTKTYREYPGKDAAHPILSRMSQFVLSADLNQILGRPSTLDFFSVMQTGKIFLADISKGRFGAETMTLLGSLLVSQFQLAAMRRVDIPKPGRTPYYLYVDEFQNFRTSAFSTILSEVPKYGLLLTMAHQFNYQLDEETRRAVLGTVGTRVFFRLGIEDVKFIQPLTGSNAAEDLLDYSVGEAIFSPSRVSSAKRIRTSIFEPRGEKASPNAILQHTFQTYGAAPPPPPPPTIHPLDDEPGPSSPPPS